MGGGKGKGEQSQSVTAWVGKVGNGGRRKGKVHHCNRLGQVRTRGEEAPGNTNTGTGGYH